MKKIIEQAEQVIRFFESEDLKRITLKIEKYVELKKKAINRTENNFIAFSDTILDFKNCIIYMYETQEEKYVRETLIKDLKLVLSMLKTNLN